MSQGDSERLEVILAAARAVLDCDGIESLSLVRTAEAAGLTSSEVEAFFDSSAALLRAVMVDAKAGPIPAIQAAVSHEKPSCPAYTPSRPIWHMLI